MASLLVRSKVTPAIPTDSAHFMELEEDLIRIGCVGFLHQGWHLKHAPMLEELTSQHLPAGYSRTLRAQPEKWTLAVWRQVYNFERGGEGLATRKEDCTKGKFITKPHPNDGYKIEDCIDERERRLLAFLVPIIHPKKPATVPITIASTILSAMAGDREVCWSRIVRDIVLDLIKGLGNSRPSPLCPFLFHLYQSYGVLLPAEVEIWNEQQRRRAQGEPEEDELPVIEERKLDRKGKKREGAHEFGSEQTTPLDTAAHRTRSKAVIPGEPASGSILPQIDTIRSRVAESEKILQDLTKLAGGCARAKLVATLRSSSGSSSQMTKMEAKVTSLTAEVGRLKTKLEISEQEKKMARNQANSSAAALLKIEEVVKQPADSIIKARLYDEMVRLDGRLSRSKIGEFIAMYATRMEAALAEMRVVVAGLSFAMPSQDSSTGKSRSRSSSEQPGEEDESEGNSRGVEQGPIPLSPDSDPQNVAAPVKHSAKPKGMKTTPACKQQKEQASPQSRAKEWRAMPDLGEPAQVGHASQTTMKVALGTPAAHPLAQHSREFPSTLGRPTEESSQSIGARMVRDEIARLDPVVAHDPKNPLTDAQSAPEGDLPHQNPDSLEDPVYNPVPQRPTGPDARSTPEAPSSTGYHHCRDDPELGEFADLEQSSTLFGRADSTLPRTAHRPVAVKTMDPLSRPDSPAPTPGVSGQSSLAGPSSAATSTPSAPAAKGFLVRHSTPLFSSAPPMIPRTSVMTGRGKKPGVRNVSIPESPVSVDQVHSTVPESPGENTEGGTPGLTEQQEGEKKLKRRAVKDLGRELKKSKG